MTTYADRLAAAMRTAKLDPAKDQTKLANLVGPPCKPQNIQHLLNANKNIRSSKYTGLIAKALGCDPVWLSDGIGEGPGSRGSAPVQHTQLGSGHAIAERLPDSPYLATVTKPSPPHWPFSFAAERFMALPDILKGRIEGFALGIIADHEDRTKKSTGTRG